jgi:hypothetical protein
MENFSKGLFSNVRLVLKQTGLAVTGTKRKIKTVLLAIGLSTLQPLAIKRSEARLFLTSFSLPLRHELTPN